MSKIADEFPSRFCYAYIVKEDTGGLPVNDRAAPFFVGTVMVTLCILGLLVIREALMIMEDMY